jgi:selenide,water dikinase
VGIITTAAKGDAADPAHLPPAIASMKRLNREAARLAQEVGVHACTDITGFALLGHGYEMAERGGVRMRFFLDRLPFLDGATRYADEWLFPAGTCHNEACFGRHVTFADDIPDELRQLLFTPETSGGLLVVAPDRADALAAAYAAADQPLWIVGDVLPGEGIEVVRIR